MLCKSGNNPRGWTFDDLKASKRPNYSILHRPNIVNKNHPCYEVVFVC